MKFTVDFEGKTVKVGNPIAFPWGKEKRLVSGIVFECFPDGVDVRFELAGNTVTSFVACESMVRI